MNIRAQGTRRRATLELVAAVLTVASWVVRQGHAWSLLAVLGLCLAWAAYVLLRAWRHPAVWDEWGVRPSSRRGWRAYGAFTLAGVVAVLVFAGVAPRPLPEMSWWTIALYPPWALAQQFALQNVFAANLRRLGLPPWSVAVVAGLALGLGHLPNVPMGLVAAAGGLAWTAMWPRWPDLWAVAASHALLGATALILVVGVDPAGEFIPLVRGVGGAPAP